MTDADAIVTELQELNRTLAGWYDAKKSEWHEGIDTKVDNIGEKVDDVGQKAEEGFTDVGRTLRQIEKAIKGIEAALVSEDNKRAVIMLHEMKGQLGTIQRTASTYSVLIVIALIAILGTLRNWF